VVAGNEQKTGQKVNCFRMQVFFAAQNRFFAFFAKRCGFKS
jgi:hypothetical protein